MRVRIKVRGRSNQLLDVLHRFQRPSFSQQWIAHKKTKQSSIYIYARQIADAHRDTVQPSHHDRRADAVADADTVHNPGETRQKEKAADPALLLQGEDMTCERVV